MKTKTIVDVRYGMGALDGRPMPLWIVNHLREDGLSWDYAFPHAMMTYRAAEYGIDILDVHTLLDVVLYEFHMDPAELNEHHPHFLYNTDEETARMVHLARVQKLKAQIEYDDPKELLRVIRDHHVENHDMALHDQHRALVTSLRERKIKAMRGAV